MHNYRHNNMTTIKTITKATVRCGFAAAILSLLFAACSDNPALEQDDSRMQLSLDVVETDWQDETIAYTRSGETLEGLRAVANPASPADGEGFGIYCAELSVSNAQVTWDNTNGKWKIGGDYNTYWRRNQSGNLNIYAYAPYKAATYTVENGILTYNAGCYSGPPAYANDLSGDNVDLLYASREDYARNSNESAVLTFRHALAKMTFGTITNNTGGTLYLNGFTIRGTLHKQAKLNLATGVWSEYTSSETAIIKPPPFASMVIDPLPDKQTIVPPMPNRELSFIPNADGTLPLTIEVNSNVINEKFSFNVTLEQGKNKTYNITIGKNYEVVVEE